MRTFLRLCILLGYAVVWPATSAQAATLTFVPSAQTVVGAGPVTVDLFISGLGLGSPPSVGAFDLDVSFDPTILSPTNVVFSSFLGDPGSGEALTTFSFVSGAVDLAALSLLLPGALDLLQPSSFRLATLSFSTLAIGTSPLTFSQILVADAFGAPLAVTATAGSVSKVPEPSSLVLISSGVGSLFVLRRRGSKANGRARR
jgi:hypothetical protein